MKKEELQKQTFLCQALRQQREEILREVVEELEKIAKWQEPQSGAGRELGALAGTGMYIQYDADRKKHETQISEAIGAIKKLK